jgi:hypothetical protein
MESLSRLRLHCPHGAEVIDLRDMPNLRNVAVSSSAFIGRGRDKPRPRIGQIRIRGVKSLDRLCIPMPEQLVLSDLEGIDWLSLDGVLKAEKLGVLRNIEIREIGLNASPNSQPSALSVFVGAFRSRQQRTSRLWLTIDVLDAAWLEQLGKLIPSPNEIRIKTRVFDSEGMIDLARLDGLQRLYIDATDGLKREIILEGPKSLGFLHLNGKETEGLRCQGWFPDSLAVPSVRRVVVSDVAEKKRVALPLSDRDDIGEFELHNAPQLEVITCPLNTSGNLRKLVVHDAPQLEWLSVEHLPKLTSFVLAGSFPKLRSVNVRSTAIDGAFLRQLEKMPSLKVLEINNCQSLSREAVVVFRKARPDVKISGFPTPIPADTHQAKPQGDVQKSLTPPPTDKR